MNFEDIFTGFEKNKYDVIYADPPWKFKNWSKKGEGKGSAGQYDCMTLEDIKSMPVQELAAKDCWLVMWATFPLMPEALEVMNAWGFKYNSGGAWHKKTKHGKTAFGTGYTFRSAAELILVGKIGTPKVLDKKTRNIIEAVAREHSRKPEEAREMVKNHFAGTNRIELFARSKCDGFDVWGNETDKFKEDL